MKLCRPEAGYYRRLNALSTADIYDEDEGKGCKRLQVNREDGLPGGVYSVRRIVNNCLRQVANTIRTVSPRSYYVLLLGCMFHEQYTP